ncbi:MAG: diguanylate cyclase domain-containing protein, partial [Anaerolineales bacterium]
ERTKRILLFLASILTGWGYLSQMEYFIGIEVFRFVNIFVLIWRMRSENLQTKLINAAKASLPFLLIAGGFLVWRAFFFESERRATDIGLQISQFFSSPLVGLWRLNYLIQDFFTVTLAAWNLPIYQLAFPMRFQEQTANLTVSMGVAIRSHGAHFDPEALIAEADMALYEAKIQGR